MHTLDTCMWAQLDAHANSLQGPAHTHSHAPADTHVHLGTT